jgi:hypothetical protein
MNRNITAAARAGIALIVLTLATALAQAQPYRDRVGSPRGGEHYDARFSHNHYYANRGVFVGSVPVGGAWVTARAGGRFYYSGGVWYAARGPGFVVVGPPLGVFVPVLPPFYTTVWFAGVPYYYANDTYYEYRADQGYEVVDPPTDPGAAVQGPQGPSYPGAPPPSANGPPPEGEDLFVYPQSGQSPDQEANDKYECHKWASSQTGFDPTQTGGGVAPDQTVAKGTDYKRAMRACLEGRGYSVR